VVTRGLCSIIYWTPLWFKKRLMRLSSELAEEAHYLTAETNLIDYYVVMNILHMAHTETLEIREIDEEIRSVVGENMSKMVFLYGPNDKYAPKQYWEELRVMFPEVNAHLADEEIPHAFVTTHPEPVATKVHPWIVEKLDQHYKVQST